MRTRLAGVVLALGAGAIAACVARQSGTAGDPQAIVDAAGRPGETSDSCLLVSRPGPRRDTITIVVESDRAPWAAPRELFDTTDPGAAAAPPMVLAQVYEPLVRITCTGDLWAALAERWASDPGGAQWTFELRGDARFADGSAVTAADFRGAWAARRSGGTLVLGIFPLLFDDRVERGDALSVSTHDSQPAGPRIFASLALAVARPGVDRRWPMGTGRYEVDAAGSRGGAWILRPVVAGSGPILRLIGGNGDQRDALDRGVDVLVTRDPLVVDYARRAGVFDMHPLPWDRTYVLAIPARAAAQPVLSLNVDTGAATGLRESLARDAVRAEARAGAAPDWWRPSPTCHAFIGDDLPVPIDPEGPRRLVYDPLDPVGRALAERIVAIVRGGGGQGDAASLAAIAPELTRGAAAPLVAAPATTGELHRGSAVAFVMHVSSRTTGRCMELRRLKIGGHWLRPEVMVPLVETRQRLITRPGIPPIRVDWDGVLRIEPSMRSTPPRLP